MKLHQGSAGAATATMVGEGKRPSRPFAPVALAFSSSIVSPRMLAIAVSSNVIIVLVTVSRYSRCANRSVSWTLLPWSLGVSFMLLTAGFTLVLARLIARGTEMRCSRMTQYFLPPAARTFIGVTMLL